MRPARATMIIAHPGPALRVLAEAMCNFATL